MIFAIIQSNVEGMQLVKMANVHVPQVQLILTTPVSSTQNVNRIRFP